MKKKLLKLMMVFSALLIVGGTTTQPALARSFGGSHSSFHSSPKIGGRSSTRSYHTPSKPSRGGSIFGSKGKSSYHAPSYKSKNYTTNRNYSNSSRRGSGLGSMFGRSLVRGAGWSIGSNMGNSLWHTMFGFGGNSYVQNGHTYQQEGGHLGWVIVIIILAIIAYFVYRNRRNRRR